MQKIIKVGNKVTVILENGNVEERLVTEEEFKKIVEPLYLKDNIQNYIYKKSNAKGFSSCPINMHPNINAYIYALNSLRGHKGTNDFFTIISNDDKKVNMRKGIYKDINNIIIDVDDKPIYIHDVQYIINFQDPYGQKGR